MTLCVHVSGAYAMLSSPQSALLSEREETKLALVMEKQALEEARTARIKVRSLHVTHVHLQKAAGILSV